MEWGQTWSWADIAGGSACCFIDLPVGNPILCCRFSLKSTLKCAPLWIHFSRSMWTLPVGPTFASLLSAYTHCRLSSSGIHALLLFTTEIIIETCEAVVTATTFGSPSCHGTQFFRQTHPGHIGWFASCPSEILPVKSMSGKHINS